MVRYLASSVATAIPTLLGAITLIFFLMRLTPGDPAEIRLGENQTPELVAQMRKNLGLDQPLPVQYLRYLADVATGDLGESYKTPQPVADLVMGQLRYTVQLAIAGTLMATGFGLATGLLAAAKANTWVDHVVMVLATIWIATPSFWLALLLMLLFSVWLPWLPMQGVGHTGQPLSVLSHLVLPAIVIGSRQSALIARLTRSAMLDVLSQDYIRTGHAKGLAASDVLLRHALRNALIPVVTIIGTHLGGLLAGSVIVETVFGRPGMGRLLVDAIGSRDYPLVQGTILTFTLLIVVVNLLVDLSYGLIDRRVRVAGTRAW